jgi:hypothetical protein
VLADVHAEYANRAACGPRDSIDHAQGRGFAGAVGPEQSKAYPRRDIEIEMIDSQAIAELFGNRSRLDYRRSNRRRFVRSRRFFCNVHR